MADPVEEEGEDAPPPSPQNVYFPFLCLFLGASFSFWGRPTVTVGHYAARKPRSGLPVGDETRSCNIFPGKPAAAVIQ